MSDAHRHRTNNPRISFLFAISIFLATALLTSCCTHDKRTGGRRPKATDKEIQPSGPPFSNPLKVTPRDQEALYSCWSTCAEMIMETIGGERVRQCQQSSRIFNSSCCNARNELDTGYFCDQPHEPDFPGYTSDHPASPLDWAAATKEIKEGRPFAFSHAPRAGGMTHMMVAIGWDDGAAEQTLIVLDPHSTPYSDSPRTTIPTSTKMVLFTDYSGSATWEHKDTYVIVRKNP